MIHENTLVGDIHIPYNYSYANKTAREAVSGFVAGDVGKLAYQTDTKELWILIDDSPITWRAVSGQYKGTTLERTALGSSLASTEIAIFHDTDTNGTYNWINGAWQ